MDASPSISALHIVGTVTYLIFQMPFDSVAFWNLVKPEPCSFHFYV